MGVDCLLSLQMNRLGMTRTASAKDNWRAGNLNRSRSKADELFFVFVDTLCVLSVMMSARKENE